MKHLAQALAIATSYIAYRPPVDDDEEDQDVAILEHIAAIMQSADQEEVQALADGASELANAQTDETVKEQLLNLTLHLGLTEEEA